MVFLAFILGVTDMTLEEVLSSDLYAEVISDPSMKVLRLVLIQHAR
jgi:hypothetical protein